MSVLLESNETAWPLLSRGKVRDIYDFGPHELLIVTTDRLSAFDVILPTGIPDKGVVLTQISNFWFGKLSDIIPNHLVDPEPFGADGKHAHRAGRSVVVRKAQPLPVEAIVRGYLTGSGLKDYQRTGSVSGIPLPAGL
ncbi:MAG: phosphoribosylaminoimidazolesuccinocarboxamide synthase, partial [Actinomycetes bacterium]